MATSVILPDGKALALQDGTTAFDAARAISPRLAEAVVVARVDGAIQDLRVPLRDGAKLELLKADTPEGRDTINHSAEHLLATAVLRLFPGAKVTMGPKNHGDEFYYDFDVAGRTFTPSDLEMIEAEVKKLIEQKIKFEWQLVPKKDALGVFEGLGQKNEYKTEILSWIPEDSVSIYRCGEFVDFCRGPHLPHAGFIKGLKITSSSAAYWRADATKQSLQRVRGVAFPNKDDLDKYVRRLEEAKKRDHRTLGRDLELYLVSERYDTHAYSEKDEIDLYVGVDAEAPLDRALVEHALGAAASAFPGRTIRRTVKFGEAPKASADGAGGSNEEARPRLHVRLRGAAAQESKSAFRAAVSARKDADVEVHFEPHYVEEIGAGLVMWLPKGGLLRTIIEDQWRKMHLEEGYDIVYSPHIAKADLWKTSGHWDFYREGMFSPMSVDGHDYCCKPMNCPFHILMVKSRTRSYREFPMRLAELGTVYRYEAAGVMHGLMRVRGFTQDDAHLFCRADQVEQEIHRVLRFILKMLRTFGFEQFDINLSTRPEKYVGDLEDWAKAERTLEGALQALGLEYQVDPGGGAFYGPKIDIKLVDALDRRWQCSTLQYDFNNPERFTLGFVNAKGELEQPIMLHRALLGSIERFIGVLLEHHAGALPAWLSPEQARVVTVSDKHNDHAEQVTQALRAHGIRASFVRSSEKLGAKIREAQVEKIPHMLVIGDKEVEAKGATVRLRDGSDRGFMKTEALAEFLREQCAIPDVT
ncbi:threonine--tRNA ligase [Sorangium sp. So ce693]|uniref:threonine--tRNA ligase n=1 Tax=Sorangium sp. So ce693 TaxID=3133318 RepID=UPI003F608097